MREEVNQALHDLIQEELEVGAGEVALEAGRVLNGRKRLRPILFLLAYQLAGGKAKEDVMPLALAFELIHTATLVHDDINDEAQQRRGIPTIHAQAGQAKAVIAGDWLFVQGFGSRWALLRSNRLHHRSVLCEHRCFGIPSTRPCLEPRHFSRGLPFHRAWENRWSVCFRMLQCRIGRRIGRRTGQGA